ncbi:hypothetical protein YC2023_039651 [Brassica napus]
MRGWTEKMSDDELEIVRNTGGDVKRAVVPVILDVGGTDTLIPNELLNSVDVLSSNETELSLLTEKHTETFEQFSQAVTISWYIILFLHITSTETPRFWLLALWF